MRRILAMALVMVLTLCACAQAEMMPVAEDMLIAVDMPLATAVPLPTAEPQPTARPAENYVAHSYNFGDEMLAIDDVRIEKEHKEWENILLLGGDSRSTNAYERTDSMIIISINREESLVKMTSIMRDTWVNIPGHKHNKINAANVFGGPELVVQTVNQSFGTDIEDYVIVNMSDMATIIDLMDGIDLEISEAEKNEINNGDNGGVQLRNAGLVHLNGKQAVTFSRIRYIDSDYKRVMRQQRILLSMADKAQNMEVDELTEIAADVKDIVFSSLDKGELEDLAMAFMVMEVADVEQFRVPAEGTFESGTFDGVWSIRPDLEKNQALLREFIYG